MNIVSILNAIDAGEVVLPAIQRDFIWPEEKISTLMDSILRGYPIGIVLMWETYNDIQYRRFERSFREGAIPSFMDNVPAKKLRIVLDGQQRLQSLYVALYGDYEARYLYFDVLSGSKSDDSSENLYDFAFGTADDAAKWNTQITDNATDSPQNSKQHWERLSVLFKKSVADKQIYRKELTTMLALDDPEQLRLETNLSRVDEVLTKDQNILKTSTIDEDKPVDSAARQTESDVLEIFVRINKQGTPLSRSDLIFSMLKLNWKESATALPQFVAAVNEGNSFLLDVDFVIRCLYAVSDLGTKFDIDLLRTKSNIETMQANFDACCRAIQSTIDNVQKYCWIHSSKVLGGANNLVPFVYYLFHSPKHELPTGEIGNFRKSLFLFSFAGPFSRYADSRLARFIRDELKPLCEAADYSFPFLSAVRRVSYWETISNWDAQLVQHNVLLALSLIQHDTGSKAKFKMNSPEMDHIFPASTLREKGFDESLVNHFANFWILAKGKNINKTNRTPKSYFKDVPDIELQNALIPRDMLDYGKYRSFLRQRSQAIVDKLSKKIGLGPSDFSHIEAL